MQLTFQKIGKAASKASVDSAEGQLIKQTSHKRMPSLYGGRGGVLSQKRSAEDLNNVNKDKSAGVCTAC